VNPINSRSQRVRCSFVRAMEDDKPLCLAFPPAPADKPDTGMYRCQLLRTEPFRPSSLMVLLFLKVTGIDSRVALRTTALLNADSALNVGHKKHARPTTLKTYLDKGVNT
jgi:hypothetical protein